MKRAIILGSGGLIGKTVLDYFRTTGIPVVAVDLFAQKAEAGVEWVQGSINDETLMEQLIQPGDDVFHFAHGSFPGSPNEWEDNLSALEVLNKLCLLAADRGSRIIFPSSGGTVYGEANEPFISENHPMSPISVYGLVKKMAEDLIAFHGRTHSLPYVVIRIANCYGSGFRKGKPHGIIGVAAGAILHQTSLGLVGEGKQVRDFIHAKDVASLCASIYRSDCTAAIVNAGSGKGYSMLEVVRLVEEYLGQSAKLTLLPARDFDVQRNVLNSGLARQLFRWDVKIPIEEGIAETCERLRQEEG